MPDTGRVVNRRLARLWLRDDHHGPSHAGVDRALVVIDPGVWEGDAVAAPKGEAGPDRRVQILLVQQDARCSFAIRVGFARWRRGLAVVGKVVHFPAGAGVPDVRGKAPGRRELQL